MGDTLVTVVAIFLAAVLMFVFPLMSVSERSDDISQLSVQASTVEFVDKVRSTGKLTLDDYSKFVETLGSTGNTYDVEMELKVLDENPGKKAAQGSVDKIGENVYYTMYTSQIMDELSNGSKNGKKTLKEGDIFTVNVKNTNKTISQLLRNFFYQVTGNDSYQVSAEHTGIVTVNGK